VNIKVHYGLFLLESRPDIEERYQNLVPPMNPTNQKRYKKPDFTTFNVAISQ